MSCVPQGPNNAPWEDENFGLYSCIESRGHWPHWVTLTFDLTFRWAKVRSKYRLKSKKLKWFRWANRSVQTSQVWI